MVLPLSYSYDRPVDLNEDMLKVSTRKWRMASDVCSLQALRPKKINCLFPVTARKK